MPKENIFHSRSVLSARLNDLEAKIPIIVAATGEELTQPENHFKLSEEEKKISRLQLFTKKGKMFGYQDNKPTTKVSKLATQSIVISGKVQPMAAASIMQNEEQLSVLKANASIYMKKVLLKPTLEDKSETHLDKMVNRLYQIIKNSCPAQDEVIHFVIMERDLAEPSSSKNRLPTEFCRLLLSELRKKIIENHESWKVEFDRILASKHRTSRAESYGIHRIAQQGLMLYQSMYDEEITPNEKVIIVDDHIQAGSAVAISASEVLRRNANLLTIACISSHKNNLFFNIQPKVIEFITSLLPQGEEDLRRLNEILQLAGLTIETLTNHEGLILSAIFCDPENEEHKAKFLYLLNTYDVSLDINNSLFINQENSLRTDFEKPKVEFSNFRSELLSAIEKGRYTIPYTKQMILTFKAGQDIRNKFNARTDLPWLLFDFDGTLHNLHNNTFRIFQAIIKTYCGVEIPLETIEQTRQSLKDSKHDQYQYQEMLLSFIKQYNSSSTVSFEDITKAYETHKISEPFSPKMSKDDFLALRNKYRIGIITDGSTFEHMVPKIKAFYGVDIDGYVHHDANLPSKPNPAMFHEFCKRYDVKTKPVAYVGDRKDLDGEMASKVNLKFIKVDPALSGIDMEKFTKELTGIEIKRVNARNHWKFLKSKIIKQPEMKESAKDFDCSVPRVTFSNL